MAELTVTPSHAASVHISRYAPPAFHIAHARPSSSDGIAHGTATISGGVYEKASPNIPMSRQVRCFDLQTGRLVGSTWSATDGAYTIGGLAPARMYFVVSHDHTGTYNAVIRDRILAE